MGLTLRDISYFLAVAKSGLLAAAAEECGVTQPALTKAIQRVEAEFGLELFERNARGMRLTSAGLRFLEQAQRLHSDYVDTMLLANEMRARHAGMLRIGVTDTTSGNLMMPALAALVSARPGLRTRLRIGRSDTLAAEVGNGDLDVALVPAYDDGKPFECEAAKIDNDPLLPLVRAGHPLTRKARVTLDDLTPYGWILADPKAVVYKLVTKLFANHKLPAPRVVVEIPHASEATLSLLAATDLISLVPESFFRYADKERFQPLPIAQLRLPRSIVLLTRAGSSLSPLMEALRETLMLQKNALKGRVGIQRTRRP